MSRTAAQLSVGQGLLELSWTETLDLRRHGVDIGDATQILARVDWLVGVAGAMAMGLQKPEDADECARVFPTKLRRVGFGSPLAVLVEVPSPAIEFAVSLGFLMFGLKRAWGLDLELRTCREERRREFAEAKEQRLLAERRLAKVKADLGEVDSESAFQLTRALNPDQFAEAHAAMDATMRWPKGASEKASVRDRKWDGDQALLHVDED